jgi:hypothetical protein
MQYKHCSASATFCTVNTHVYCCLSFFSHFFDLADHCQTRQAPLNGHSPKIFWYSRIYVQGQGTEHCRFLIVFTSSFDYLLYYLAGHHSNKHCSRTILRLFPGFLLPRGRTRGKLTPALLPFRLTRGLELGVGLAGNQGIRINLNPNLRRIVGFSLTLLLFLTFPLRYTPTSSPVPLSKIFPQNKVQNNLYRGEQMESWRNSLDIFNCNSLPITTPTKSNLTITLIWGGIGGVHYIPNSRNNNCFIPKISIIHV